MRSSAKTIGLPYCGRSVDQMQPRYRVPPGFAKSEVLFNMHRATATAESKISRISSVDNLIGLSALGFPRLARASHKRPKFNNPASSGRLRVPQNVIVHRIEERGLLTSFLFDNDLGNEVLRSKHFVHQ